MDVYGEKPLSHCLMEGRAMADAQKRNGRIWQTGRWQRSQGNFRYAGGQYIFNWSTKGLKPGMYRLYIDLGDGVDRHYDVTLR